MVPAVRCKESETDRGGVGFYALLELEPSCMNTLE